METNEDDDPNYIDNIFKIEGNLFDFDTPLCKAFNEFNYLLKIDKDLFTFDIQEIKTYEEYELNNNMTGDLKEPWSDNGVPYQLCNHICKPYHFKNGKTKWPTYRYDIDGFCNGGELPGMVRVGCMTYFQDHKWYDKLTDRKVKKEALMHKARFKESWGDAAPGVMKLCASLKSSFKNFHELDYDVLIRDDEILIHADNEYVAIKEREHSDHSRTNVDACQAYRELFRIMDEGWLVTKAMEE
ncbi:hypothetical protein Tco_1081303 [Tanacetum coccineum]|uniref:Uncharacterized protein n=1 Tax=Tanacetum coccineum TaxID=301880 RepID=A0ABQ5HX76_9ASTR